MAASARASELCFNLLSSMADSSKLRYSLHSSLQLIFKPPQEPASSVSTFLAVWQLSREPVSFVVAFTADYNLYGSLHNSLLLMCLPSSGAAFLAVLRPIAYNLCGSLRSSLQLM
ncbi:hypothetical protein Tco_0951991 [Tanacetum coccineum]|uniref:Uncharacterized protein n=1 Tax=Tanacetum coccineum TaxID=301880 RepID=A0ABQ5DYJ8_9ASTR